MNQSDETNPRSQTQSNDVLEGTRQLSRGEITGTDAMQLENRRKRRSRRRRRRADVSTADSSGVIFGTCAKGESCWCGEMIVVMDHLRRRDWELSSHLPCIHSEMCIHMEHSLTSTERSKISQRSRISSDQSQISRRKVCPDICTRLTGESSLQRKKNTRNQKKNKTKMENR